MDSDLGLAEVTAAECPAKCAVHKDTGHFDLNVTKIHFSTPVLSLAVVQSIFPLSLARKVFSDI